jgi:hypothetical protein
MENLERFGTAIISDREGANFRDEIKNELEKDGIIEVILESRTKISRIKQEIKLKNPKISLVVASSLSNSEEFNDLWGFVRGLNKHLPQTNIIIYSPSLSREETDKIFEKGALACIDDRLGHQFLGPVIKSIVSEHTVDPRYSKFVAIKG